MLEKEKDRHNRRFQEEMNLACEGLFRILNNFSYGNQAKAFHKALESQHPTLQQNFWRTINSVISLYAESECHRDARNEASFEYCKFFKAKIKEAENEYRVYFPTI